MCGTRFSLGQIELGDLQPQPAPPYGTGGYEVSIKVGSGVVAIYWWLRIFYF